MPQAYDQSGQIVDVAPGDFERRFVSGDISLVSGADYHVQAPDGTIGTVPAGSMGQAIDQGYKLVTDADVQAYKAKRDYGGVKGAAIAAGGGALEQGTLGAGDALLPDSWKAAIQTSEALHPWATMGGQVAGTAGLAAITGGLGEAAGLGGALEGGVGGVAERAAASFLPDAAETALGRVATRASLQAARGVAEGGQFGAAQAFADHAIAPEDHPLTAESILSEIGGDALWGGALGAGVGGAGGALGALFGRGGEAAEGAAAKVAAQAPEAAESLPGDPWGLAPEGQQGALDRALSDQRGPAQEDVAAAAAKAANIPDPAPGLGSKVAGWYAKVSGALSGADPDAIAEFMSSPEARKTLLEADDIRTEASRSLTENFNDILSASRPILEEGEAPIKRGHIAAAVKDVDPTLAAKTTADALDDTLATLAKMHENPKDYGAPEAVNHALTFASDKAAQIQDAISSGDVAGQFSLLDQLKKGLGKYTKGASQIAQRGAATDELMSMQNRARAETLQDLYERLRQTLQNQDVWKRAAVDQTAVNQAWSRQLDASKRFIRAITTNVGRDPDNPWVDMRGADPAKVDSYVKNLTSPAQDLTHRDVVNYVDSTRDLVDAMKTQWELPPDKLALVHKLGRAADAMHDTLDKTTDALTLVNQFGKIRGAALGHAQSFLGLAGSIVGGAAGGHLGAGIGGLAGYALGGLGKLVTGPHDTIMHLARIESMVRRSDGRIARGIRGFLAGRRLAPEKLPTESYARKAAKIADLASNPADTAARIDANIGTMGHISAGLRSSLTATALSGLHLLASKLPQRPDPDPLHIEAEAPLPPPGVREAWLRTFRAVQDPTSVIRDLQAGRVSTEGIEVLQQVYPSLYARAQEHTMAALASGKYPDLSKQQKLGLAMVMNLPTPTLNPSYIRERQAAFSQPMDAEEPQGSPNTGARGRKPPPKNVPQPLTTAQRVELGAAGAAS